MLLNRLSISSKVRMAFVLVFILISGVGAFSIERLHVVSMGTKELQEKWLPSISAAGGLRTQLKDFSIARAKLVISYLAGNKDAGILAEASMNQEKDNLDKKRANYEPFIIRGTECETSMQDFDDAWQKMQATSASIVNAAKSNDVKTLESLYTGGDDTKAFSAAVSAMDAVVAFEKNMAKKSADYGEEIYNKTRTLLIGIVIAAAVICVILGLFLINSTSRPVSIIAGLMTRLAKNDFNIKVFGTARGDEIGGMARAVEVFHKNGLEKIRLEKEVKERELAAEIEKKQLMHNLADSFEASTRDIINRVGDAVAQMFKTSQNMQQIIAGVSTQSGAVSSASSKTLANVQTVAAAVEEMSSSVKEISGQITKTSTLTNDAVSKTVHADKSTQLLSSAVAQIGEILTMIENIAGQINLLALNATIESARAGDAGKGFAVVASEVKNLANQTSKATETISEQIKNINTVSAEVVKALAEIQGVIGNIDTYTGGIAAAVEEQSAATGEIAMNMQGASQGVQNITSSIGHVSQGALEADSAALEVMEAAKILSKQSELLNYQIKVFLKTVRT